MVYETFSAEETEKLGEQIGREAKPGEVYTLIGDLGVGKTVFTQGIAKGLEITEPICSPTLLLCKSMKKEECHFIILMYTGLRILRKWMKSAMRTIFMEMV